MDSESSFIEDAIHYILNAVDKEDLKFLLSKDEEWEKFVTEAELSRDEARELREGLKNQKTAKGTDFIEKPQEEHHYRERFLKLYPQVKKTTEEYIAQLYSFADKLDKLHKDTTLSYLAADTTGLFSGILSIVGINLAPVTAGISLAVAGFGLFLGVVATASTVATSVVEHRDEDRIEAEIERLESTGIKPLKLAFEVMDDCGQRVGSTSNSYSVLKRVVRHIRALRLSRVDPNLAMLLWTRHNSLIERVFGEIPEEITWGTRIWYGVTTGFTILVDIYSIVEESKKLLYGAKTETGKKLRQRAQALETLLKELKEVYERLQMNSNNS